MSRSGRATASRARLVSAFSVCRGVFSFSVRALSFGCWCAAWKQNAIKTATATWIVCIKSASILRELKWARHDYPTIQNAGASRRNRTTIMEQGSKPPVPQGGALGERLGNRRAPGSVRVERHLPAHDAAEARLRGAERSDYLGNERRRIQIPGLAAWVKVGAEKELGVLRELQPIVSALEWRRQWACGSNLPGERPAFEAEQKICLRTRVAYRSTNF